MKDLKAESLPHTHPQGQADGWTLALQGAKDRAILVGQGFVGPVSEALG